MIAEQATLASMTWLRWSPATWTSATPTVSGRRNDINVSGKLPALARRPTGRPI